MCAIDPYCSLTRNVCLLSGVYSGVIELYFMTAGEICKPFFSLFRNMLNGTVKLSISITSRGFQYLLYVFARAANVPTKIR